jgi:hypothetical protein
MSYQVKKTITSIVSTTLIMAAYCLYTIGKYQAGAIAAGNLKFWATTILIFIGIGIIASIIIQIVFHILLSISIAVKEKMRDVDCDEKEIEKSIGAELVEDEMDKLIELKSTRFGFYLSGLGFVAALLALVFNYSPVVMINILFVSFFAGPLVSAFAQLHYYRKGVDHA